MRHFFVAVTLFCKILGGLASDQSDFGAIEIAPGGTQSREKAFRPANAHAESIAQIKDDHDSASDRTQDANPVNENQRQILKYNDKPSFAQKSDQSPKNAPFSKTRTPEQRNPQRARSRLRMPSGGTKNPRPLRKRFRGTIPTSRSKESLPKVSSEKKFPKGFMDDMMSGLDQNKASTMTKNDVPPDVPNDYPAYKYPKGFMNDMLSGLEDKTTPSKVEKDVPSNVPNDYPGYKYPKGFMNDMISGLEEDSMTKKPKHDVQPDVPNDYPGYKYPKGFMDDMISGLDRDSSATTSKKENTPSNVPDFYTSFKQSEESVNYMMTSPDKDTSTAKSKKEEIPPDVPNDYPGYKYPKEFFKDMESGLESASPMSPRRRRLPTRRINGPRGRYGGFQRRRIKPPLPNKDGDPFQRTRSPTFPNRQRGRFNNNDNTNSERFMHSASSPEFPNTRNSNSNSRSIPNNAIRRQMRNRTVLRRPMRIRNRLNNTPDRRRLVNRRTFVNPRVITNRTIFRNRTRIPGRKVIRRRLIHRPRLRKIIHRRIIHRMHPTRTAKTTIPDEMWHSYTQLDDIDTYHYPKGFFEDIDSGLEVVPEDGLDSGLEDVPEDGLDSGLEVAPEDGLDSGLEVVPEDGHENVEEGYFNFKTTPGFTEGEMPERHKKKKHSHENTEDANQHNYMDVSSLAPMEDVIIEEIEEFIDDAKSWWNQLEKLHERQGQPETNEIPEMEFPNDEEMPEDDIATSLEPFTATIEEETEETVQMFSTTPESTLQEPLVSSSASPSDSTSAELVERTTTVKKEDKLPDGTTLAPSKEEPSSQETEGTSPEETSTTLSELNEVSDLAVDENETTTTEPVVTTIKSSSRPIPSTTPESKTLLDESASSVSIPETELPETSEPEISEETTLKSEIIEETTTTTPLALVSSATSTVAATSDLFSISESTSSATILPSSSTEQPEVKTMNPSTNADISTKVTETLYSSTFAEVTSTELAKETSESLGIDKTTSVEDSIQSSTIDTQQDQEVKSSVGESTDSSTEQEFVTDVPDKDEEDSISYTVVSVDADTPVDDKILDNSYTLDADDLAASASTDSSSDTRASSSADASASDVDSKVIADTFASANASSDTRAGSSADASASDADAKASANAHANSSADSSASASADSGASSAKAEASANAFENNAYADVIRDDEFFTTPSSEEFNTTPFEGYTTNSTALVIIEPPEGVDCGTNMSYYECVPNCRHTCFNYDSFDVPCPQFCIPGCFCNIGLVIDENGRCVPPKNCFDLLCDLDEEWWDCMPTCHNTCENYARASACKDTSCEPGCFCRIGTLRDVDGSCREPEDCNIPVCKDNEDNTECLNTCNTCEANCHACRLTKCDDGCDCRDGYKRDAYGECVHASLCPVCTSPAPSNTTIPETTLAPETLRK